MKCESSRQTCSAGARSTSMVLHHLPQSSPSAACLLRPELASLFHGDGNKRRPFRPSQQRRPTTCSHRPPLLRRRRAGIRLLATTRRHPDPPAEDDRSSSSVRSPVLNPSAPPSSQIWPVTPTKQRPIRLAAPIFPMFVHHHKSSRQPIDAQAAPATIPRGQRASRPRAAICLQHHASCHDLAARLQRPPRTISLHPPSASSRPADQPVACQLPIDARSYSHDPAHAHHVGKPASRPAQTQQPTDSPKIGHYPTSFGN
ncbi:hypothetical protein ACLOJK_015129 [Asimina triloba]